MLIYEVTYQPISDKCQSQLQKTKETAANECNTARVPIKVIAASVGNCWASQNGSHILLSLHRCLDIPVSRRRPNHWNQDRNGDETTPRTVECAIHFAKPSNFQPTLRSAWCPCPISLTHVCTGTVNRMTFFGAQEIQNRGRTRIH